MKKWILVTAFASFSITLVESQSVFLKIEGVSGEATDHNHKDWINLVSFSQAISSPSPTAATGAARRRGSVILEDITCMKELDKSSPKLAEAVCKGKVFPKVEIQMTKALSDGAGDTYYTYELKNVMVTSYQINGTEGSAPFEEFTLSFSEIKTVYTEYDAQGRKKGNIEYSWKVEEGK